MNPEIKKLIELLKEAWVVLDYWEHNSERSKKIKKVLDEYKESLELSKAKALATVPKEEQERLLEKKT